MSGPYKGGYEEGMPLTTNIMMPLGFVEPSLPHALAIGASTAANNRQGVEGYDFRNFRRSNHIPGMTNVVGKERR